MSVIINPIGIIHSSINGIEGAPIQSALSDCRGIIEVNNEFVPGLEDLDGFSHIILIYYFHLSNGFDLKPIPFLDSKAHGVFSTRAPKRPNPIGISVVKLMSVKNNILEVENIDIINGTPLIDIKPYIPEFDVFLTQKNGWMDNKISGFNKVRSDSRFK